MNRKLKLKNYVLLLLSLVLLLGATTLGFVRTDVVNAAKKSASPQVLKLDHSVASMTEKRTFNATFTLPKDVSVKSISWTYGGKPLSQWKKYKERSYDGPSFITVHNIKVTSGRVHAKITFDLPYDTSNLNEPRLQRPLYKSLLGTYNLAVKSKGRVIAQNSIKLTPYDSYYSYMDLKTEIDSITAQAAKKNHRYIKTTSIGKSVEGRDIYLTILAKDKATIDKYQKVIHPAMLNNPKKLQEKINSGILSDYQVPIWLNNIHPNETPGVSAILNYFKAMALDNKVTYNTIKSKMKSNKTTLKIDDALKHVFFIFVYTDNPDGLEHGTRYNAKDYDLNRDNTYQTQPETQAVTEQIAKWSPISFLDMHGFDGNFLIEPCTPPHDPNVEIDLLMNHMVEQAKAMGEAGIANTKYKRYYIPYEEHQKFISDPKYVTKGTESNWDDLSAAYTASLAMHHGAMGHTIEIPEMNEESTKALFYSTAGATNYVIQKKKDLFLNQLKIYERGVNNIDDHSVDRYLLNAKNEEIGRPRICNQNFYPEYYILPINSSVQKNPLEVYRMVKYLLRNGVKVERSTKDVTVAGITYPADSFVINMHQAERGFANLVLYDGIDVSDYKWVSGEFIQNFHDLRGFDRYIVREAKAFTDKTSSVTSISIPETKIPTSSEFVLIKNSNNDAIKAVNSLIAADKTVTMLTQGGPDYEAGDFVVSYKDLKPVASKYYLDVKTFSNTKPDGKTLNRSIVGALGQTADVLKELGFKVTDNQSVADVLVNTFDSDKYVNEGKPYIAFGNMGMMNIKNLIPEFEFKGPEWERYEGVFLTNVKQDNVITAPYNEQEYFYTITGSYITSVPKTAEILALISDKSDFFKAGWWPGHDAARGKILAFKYKGEKKQLTVFANDLLNDGHTQNQYRLLANSIFDAGANKNVTPEYER
ncbi:M14 family metallopeptidase [Anaeromicropila herbilytica]|uniref:Zinc carboxypeptidase n=1 Tax=Anaeromicropila herbilytica TaxID=2785025 RepID=A0A7R7EI83_9FIRM|nr:M14 family metallopeptidase [Anaeromicropila herbilytica]BCN29220.1 zinc carboxypeptidase [Anaeromicropila herbilytica]